MTKSSRVRINIPGWAVVLYISCSIILIPWTIYLDQSLHAHHLFGHWDIAWVGLDAAEILALLLTGLLALRKSLWVVLPAVATGSFLLVDAWFDVMGARPGNELLEALGEAVFIELPLAAISFYLASRVLRKARDQ